ncbi:MAG: lysine--tRNA ligase [Candidatus Micrarchaeota archaeon]|nr:lysine--tRNA ligase [Candidatus Micrarchaeota archaeon]
MAEHKHWSEQLADQIIAEKKEPYVVSSGMTTSGPAHFGTVCEFLFPFVISKMLKARGKKVEFYLIGDILDAFDKIPIPMEKYRVELEPHLGKPLCDVPDPTGTSKSFGDYFLNEVIELMKKLGVTCNVLRANDMYADGKFDEYAKLYLRNEAQAKEIIERTSGRQLPKDFSVIMPICEKCGKIATTRVTKHDGGIRKISTDLSKGQTDVESYEYSCDKDVKYTKGCNYNGKNKITDHKYKIMWRLHWPAWKQILGTTIEGAGVDHHTKGGSEDTCKIITLELIKKEYHIPYRYGFILLEGKKYSKSKGIGLGISELLTLIPPEILKYLLLRPDLEENIDINPTAENLLRSYEEFQQAGELSKQDVDTLDRANRKKAIAFKLSANKIHWNVPFLDVLLYYQIYQNWDKTGEMLNDKEGVNYLKPYVEEWTKRDFMPEDYNFKYQPKKAEGKTVTYVESLKSEMDALAIHNSVFEFAKANAIEPKEMFRQLYLTLISKEKGPRLGKLIFAIGIDRIKKDLL